jgi:hypothetical protein
VRDYGYSNGKDSDADDNSNGNGLDVLMAPCDQHWCGGGASCIIVVTGAPRPQKRPAVLTDIGMAGLLQKGLFVGERN